ncbi:hypothetical protein [Actinoplanes friuliensis]|uniref:Lipoprotein n=1 Tax=Actinoplanes friuliensis DSM 7358 TaxID=1246995 RepID=U5W777_9ACTN|nr:hypothetical protein [Actinoplanes friuliensis]AGZ43796.1 hypothetical protein AFR_27675 [Actinoplanes friuliensis DSM 7358]
MPTPLRALLALTLCLGGVAGCSSSSGDDNAPKVVSFRSEPVAGASAPARSAGPPVMRMDMSREEEDQLWNAFYACLAGAGVPMKKNAEGVYEFNSAEGKMQADTPEIHKACDHTLPQPPPEKDPEQNPYLKDDENNFWQCLKDHGDDVHKVADGWEPGPKWGDFPNADAVTEACEVQAYDGKRG